MNKSIYAPNTWAEICADTLASNRAGVQYLANKEDGEAIKNMYNAMVKLYSHCERGPIATYINGLVKEPERIRTEAMENIHQITSAEYTQFLTDYNLPDKRKNFAIFTNCVNYAQSRVYCYPSDFGLENTETLRTLPEDLRRERDRKYKELRPLLEEEEQTDCLEVEELPEIPPPPKPRGVIVSHDRFFSIFSDLDKLAEVVAASEEAEEKNQKNREIYERKRQQAQNPDEVAPPPLYYGGSFEALRAEHNNDYDLPAVNTNYSLLFPEDMQEIDRVNGFQRALLSVGIFSLLNDFELEERDKARKEGREPRVLQDIPREELKIEIYAVDLYKRFTGVTRKGAPDNKTFPEMLRALKDMQRTSLVIDCTEEMKRRGRKFKPGRGEAVLAPLLPIKIQFPVGGPAGADVLKTRIIFNDIPELYIYMKNSGQYAAVKPEAFRIHGSRNTPELLAINFYIRQELAQMKSGYRKNGGYILLNKILQSVPGKPPKDPKQAKKWKNNRKTDIETVLHSLVKSGELLAWSVEDLKQGERMGKGNCCKWTMKNRVLHSVAVRVPEIEKRQLLAQKKREKEDEKTVQ